MLIADDEKKPKWVYIKKKNNEKKKLHQSSLLQLTVNQSQFLSVQENRLFQRTFFSSLEVRSSMAIGLSHANNTRLKYK